MEQLLNETRLLEIDAIATIKMLERIDTNSVHIKSNYNQVKQGRHNIKNFLRRINKLEQQVIQETMESNSKLSEQKFNQLKQMASETLSNVAKKLKDLDQKFEKTVTIISTSTSDDEAQSTNTNSSDTATSDEEKDSAEESDEKRMNVIYRESLDQNEDESPKDMESVNESTSGSEKDTERSMSTESSSKENSTKRGRSKPQTIPTQNDDNDDTYFTEESSHENKSFKASDNEESNESDSDIEEFRKNEYPPGTLFRVIHSRQAADETGDLTIFENDIITLVQQNQATDWWLFKNSRTQQQGMVPINHTELYSKMSTTKLRRLPRRVKTKSSMLVDVLKRKQMIPSGFVASDLAPLTKHKQSSLSYTLIPQMTESNFDFVDLHWHHDVERIRTNKVQYQKLVTIESCLKIPRVHQNSLKVISRCVRVCLYDGTQLISNIHTIRVPFIKLKIPITESRTEEWGFEHNTNKTHVDKQSKLLVRSNECNLGKNVCLLIELSQRCRLTETNEICDIGCGWIRIPLHDTKQYNELLQGGHLGELNIILDDRYRRNMSSNGSFNEIRRSKRARIKLSIESREKYDDTLYNSLPVTSMVVPVNLVEALVFYRNELAYQCQKRYHTFDSIFLATFFQTLDQLDLINKLNELYHQRKVATDKKPLECFIEIYKLYIYPLLNYRRLPPYDIHEKDILETRHKLIQEMIKQLQSKTKKDPPNTLDVFLSPQFTDYWTPFTTNEICFSLKGLINDLN